MSSTPSRRHQALAWLVPRLRGAGELDSEEAERARWVQRHAGPERVLPTRFVPRLQRRFSVVAQRVEGAPGGEADFPTYVLTPRGRPVERTVVYLHGGSYVAPCDPVHVRYATRLAEALGARVVLPDYPLAPEHTWRDSHQSLADLTAGWATRGETILAGDSAGGGLALALALTLRDRGGPQPSRLLLLSPWVDLTSSAPDTDAFAARDPWLSLAKLDVYAAWWAGGTDDLARPEVSPGLGDLAGLPPALVFCGTRDILVPACRLLADRATAAGWDLTYVEAEGLIHVYPLLPGLPEARDAWRTTVGFLR